MGCDCNKGKKITRNTRNGKPHHTTRFRKPKVYKKYKNYNQIQYIQNKKSEKEVYFVKSDYNGLTSNDLRSWDRIHKMAVEDTTPQSQLDFKKYLKYLSYYFPCPKCTPHIKQYLKTNPIQSEFGETNFARWSWKFQNSVNDRLGKKGLSWEEFQAKYIR